MEGAVAKNLYGDAFWVIPEFSKLALLSVENSDWKNTSLKRLIELATHCSTVFDKYRIFHNDMRLPNVVDCGGTAKFIDWDFASVTERSRKTPEEKRKKVWRECMDAPKCKTSQTSPVHSVRWC
eukprot:GHVR01151226.1.p2 GENE.GHVR01151226.1~~GHVR01151226.1.p2  ORF type:complete len:124 (+),score=5.75 GHVR01151226.1:1090-1461(+)